MLVACKGKFAVIEFFNNGDFKFFTLGQRNILAKEYLLSVWRFPIIVGTL
jgi:hypothetical protein